MTAERAARDAVKRKANDDITGRFKLLPPLGSKRARGTWKTITRRLIRRLWKASDARDDS